MGLFTKSGCCNLSAISGITSRLSAKPNDWEETQEYLDKLEQEVSKGKLKDSKSAEKFKAAKQKSQNK